MDYESGIRSFGCCVVVAAVLAGCGSPSGTPAVPAGAGESVDAATTTTTDAAPETTSPADTSVREAAAVHEATVPEVAFEPGRGGGGVADTCILLADAVLPRCTPGEALDGCTLDPTSSASVAIEVLELRGYDDLGTRAFTDHVNLLLSCWEEAGDAAPEGVVLLRMTLDVAPSGCATVRGTSGDWPTRRTRECIRSVMEWMKLPAPEADGGRIELQLEFAQ